MLWPPQDAGTKAQVTEMGNLDTQGCMCLSVPPPVRKSIISKSWELHWEAAEARSGLQLASCWPLEPLVRVLHHGTHTPLPVVHPLGLWILSPHKLPFLRALN